MWFRGFAAGIAGGLLLTALGGCGEDSKTAEQAQEEFGVDLGVPVRLADCEDWNTGGVEERLGTIGEIRTFAGGPAGSPGGHGVTIPDEDAYELFENWCANDFADAFKLYKLYLRAAAFQGE